MINKVLLVGRIGKLYPGTTKSDTAACNFSLATTKKHKGEKQTTWHTINTYGTVAEIMNNYAQVGALIAVEGELIYNTYTSKQTGQEITKAVILGHKTTILADNKRDDVSQTQESVHNNGNSWYGSGESDIPF